MTEAMIEATVDPTSVSFVDTNVIVYAMNGGSDPRAKVARLLIQQLMERQTLHTSTQVLQETFVTLTRKGDPPIRPQKALAMLDRLAEFEVVGIDYPMIHEAALLNARDSISFWDALILAAAARVGAERLYTEDLQHGRSILGVTIVNPFIQ